MKNIQVIDGAENCVYDIFSLSEKDFSSIFPKGKNIAFIDEVINKDNEDAIAKLFDRLWSRPIKKSKVRGIHGTLFYGLNEKKKYYPDRRDENAVNPNGTPLRARKIV